MSPPYWIHDAFAIWVLLITLTIGLIAIMITLAAIAGGQFNCRS